MNKFRAIAGRVRKDGSKPVFVGVDLDVVRNIEAIVRKELDAIIPKVEAVLKADNNGDKVGFKCTAEQKQYIVPILRELSRDGVIPSRGAILKKYSDLYEKADDTSTGSTEAGAVIA